MPTLEQRKAAFRTIFDIVIHNKRELSNNHKYCLMRWGQSFLHLSIIEMQECLSPTMSNGFVNFWKIQCKMPPKTKKILPPENIQ